MTSPIEQYYVEISAAVKRAQKVDMPWLEYFPAEACLQVSAMNDETCWLELGHAGPHSWEPLP